MKRLPGAPRPEPPQTGGQPARPETSTVASGDGGWTRWLGATGPEASEEERRKRKRWQLAGYIAGGLFLLLACSPSPADQEESGAGAAFFANLLLALGVALLLRLLYVKLIRRDGRPFLSPWILASAIPFALAFANT